jgi:hypothetical protein
VQRVDAHGDAPDGMSEELIVSERADAFARWGVAPGPAVWPTVLHILFVIDGRIDTSSCPQCFGLGDVLETLRDPSFAWWVKFKVQVVRRDAAKLTLAGCSDNNLDTNQNQPGDPPPKFATTGFTFTEPDFSLDDWDQVWFFGDYPANLSGDIDDPCFHRLENEELKLLAEWMDRGGGVFAAGDHWNLGAAMCSRIPRVRTMRKWTPQQRVPTMDGDARNQTLQPGGTGNPDVLERDTIPQPIELVYQSLVTSILVRPLTTHPLLSTPTGAIDHFPDHMHEGEVIEDDQVELDSPLGIPGYEGVEYPFAEPGAGAAVAEVASPVQPPRPRPQPHVIAYAVTTNKKDVITAPTPVGNRALPRLGDASVGRSTVRFGLVGAYDGDRVGIGRVVVDSTWHHWFSYNLHGFKSANMTQYALMQAYYRNVGLWLANRAQRQSLLFAATWGIVVSDPMAFPEAPRRTVWAVGQRAVGVIARTVSEPMLLDFVASFFGGRAEEIFGVPADLDPADTYAESAAADLAVRSIVGGIASSLIEPAFDYLQAEGKPRRLLDPDAIARHAAQGVKQGHTALVNAVESSAAASRAIVGRLEDAFQPSLQESIPVELIELRIVAERLQLPEATDPALADGRLTFTARVALAGSVRAYAVVKEIEVPSFQPAGAVIDLDRVLYEGIVQTGESLTVEILTGEATRERVASERIRFSETIVGNPSNWTGAHAPSLNQPWRLWYRIDKPGDTSLGE